MSEILFSALFIIVVRVNGYKEYSFFLENTVKHLLRKSERFYVWRALNIL